jgi:type II secretory ATPase GspE/PulE/Tfp pilus assembly ATPase PilB-like protein
MSNAIQKLITANATSSDIQDEAIDEGMVTMQTDGFIKALRGATTVEEVLRVTREQ